MLLPIFMTAYNLHFDQLSEGEAYISGRISLAGVRSLQWLRQHYNNHEQFRGRLVEVCWQK